MRARVAGEEMRLAEHRGIDPVEARIPESREGFDRGPERRDRPVGVTPTDVDVAEDRAGKGAVERGVGRGDGPLGRLDPRLPVASGAERQPGDPGGVRL